jgi:outer membrane protein
MHTKQLCLSVLALAAAGVAGAQTKVAIINTQRAVLETAEMKKAAADLEAKYRPQQQDIEKRTKELQAIQEKLQNPKTTPQEGADLQAEGQRKQRVLQRMSEDLQAEVDRERTEILRKAGQRIQAVVTKLAEEKGFDLVLDSGNTVYFKQAMEITTEAIAAYDKAHPLKAP